MLRGLFETLKEIVLEYVKHRLFIFSLIIIALFGVLVHRLFTLQIIEGEEHLSNFNYKSERTLSVEASRGNIYDRNGELIAYNKLAYTVTFENDPDLAEAAKKKNMTENALKNEIIYKVINILESNGDTPSYDFPITIDSTGEFSYSLSSDTQIKRFIADAYGVDKIDKLSSKQASSTAKDMFLYFKNGTGATTKTKIFDIADSYSDEEALKIMAIRYNLWLNRYQQYVPVTIAFDVSDVSTAILKENSSELLGVDVEVGSIRVYNESQYYAHIIGYVGAISTDEMDEYNSNLSEDEQYTNSDMVGKTGLEKELESDLRGVKGSEKIYVDNMGRVLETSDKTDSVAGNDIYLTIDTALQKYCYVALEKEIGAILLANMVETEPEVVVNEDGTTTQTGAKNPIPLSEVYFALFNNNVLSLSHMNSDEASNLEKSTYSKIISGRETAANQVTSLLNSNTPNKDLSDEYQAYLEYVYDMLAENKILDKSIIDSTDEKFIAYTSDEISLSEYLKYCINQGAIDISVLDISSKYYDSDEVYDEVVNYVGEELLEDSNFDKLAIKYMIKSNVISCKDVALLLYDQEVLETTDKDYANLVAGTMSPYNFIRQKISDLDITPAQLALYPCEGSVVVTDVNTGELYAMVSYPSYDNNLLTNSVDSAYYNKLLNDKTKPLYNRAPQQRTAPGSTYKMLTTIAGVQEDAIQLDTEIEDESVFTKINTQAKCWIWPSSHGTIGIEEAIEVSCNYFFYEVGYRLSTDDNEEYNEALGLNKLSKYASMFGLDRTTGIELTESEPKISDTDPVRSAIGQGTNSYTATQISRYVTTIANSGTVYDLSLVLEKKDVNGNVTYTNPHNVSGMVSIADSLWNEVHNGMRRVVTNHTSETALINRINVEVAGKTGTAQEDKTKPSHALFVSYAPFNKPEISVTTVIPYGYSSGNAEELAGFIYAYQYDKSLLENESVTGNINLSD